jgi:hypothetical protein
MNLPSFTVKNWTGTGALQASCDELDKLVVITAYSGGFAFHFNATTEQARELADALHACANALETEVMEVTP